MTPTRQGLGHEHRRPDIQGLRALAILLVLADHAGVPHMAGGFIGVDLFYVLSGYLISGLLLREIAGSNTFHPLVFYARRAKRLLPALALMLASTAGLAWYLSSPLQQPQLAAAGQAASLWLSNFWFAAREINYFSESMERHVFLHTWSLGVEEQFYLVWPWLLLVLLHGTSGISTIRRLRGGLLALAGASLALSVYLAQAAPANGFFLLPGRAWEFALGCASLLLRQACNNGIWPRLARWQGRSLLNSLGLAMILATATAFDGRLRYPGLWALLPCLGASLILLDRPERTPNHPLSRLFLHWRPAQYLGDISYSLYLWHWPILVLGTAVLGQDAWVRALLALLSLLLAAGAYHLLERPLHRAPLTRPGVVLLISALTIGGCFAGLGYWGSAAEARLTTPEQRHIQGARLDAPGIYEQGCDSWYKSDVVQPCRFGANGAKHTVVLFGDSVLAQWYPAVARIYLSQPDWQIIVFTKSACAAVEVSYYYDRIKSVYQVCERWRSGALEQIVTLKPDLVIMGSTRYGFRREEWQDGTRRILQRLAPAAGQIVIMSPAPTLGFNGPDCLARYGHQPQWLSERLPAATCTKPLTTEDNPDLMAEFTAAAQPFANVSVLNLASSVCPEGLCRARLGEKIVYRDAQHLTASFAESLAPALAQGLRPAPPSQVCANDLRATGSSEQ